jgi:hypothetical protein
MSEQGRGSNSSTFIGFAFALVGLLLLLHNLEVIRIGHRWWALFFLIPIGYLLSDLGRGRQTRRSLIGLVTLLSMMVILLLGLSWAVVWPVFIIIAGLSVLLAR